MAKLQTVAIIGRSNVGKSSLFNRLLGRRWAITHDAQGTTRDVVSGRIDWNGKAFSLLDTAGLQRADGDMQEQIQDQVAMATSIADVLIVLVDGTTLVSHQDREAALLALKSGKPVILAVNKIDAETTIPADRYERLGIKDIFMISANHGRGTADMLDRVTKYLKKGSAAATAEGFSLALVGRPNVGKSSLLNALAGKQQAVVAPEAGTTRDIRTIEVTFKDQNVTLLDTAGIRRRGKIEKGVEKFSVERTAMAIEEADVCVLVMDATELSTAGDAHIGGMVKDAGKGLILAINKWDLIDTTEVDPDRLMRRLMRDFSFTPWAPVILMAAETGHNITKLFEVAAEIHKRRQVSIQTSELNRIVGDAVRKHAPAGLNNLRPKINYVVQTGQEPPMFTMFGTHPEAVHFSYRRYLENTLREHFDFIGTPITLEFKHKRKDEREAAEAEAKKALAERPKKRTSQTHGANRFRAETPEATE
jgi:GTP-binding protein